MNTYPEKKRPALEIGCLAKSTELVYIHHNLNPFAKLFSHNPRPPPISPLSSISIECNSLSNNITPECIVSITPNVSIDGEESV